MKIKINKKALALLVGTSLVLTPQKTKSQIFDAGATMNANTTVNIRLSNTTESQIIGQINQHNTATRIFSCDNGWDLIRYKDKIGYVYSPYFNIEVSKQNNYMHQELNDIVITTTNLNFRLSPSLDGKKIETIKTNEELEVIAITQNSWYLVKYNNKIGYVKAEYTSSLKTLITSLYPNIKNIELNKYGYAVSNVNLRMHPNTECEILTIINKYESFRILNEYNDWLLVKINNEIGYVNKNYIQKINGTFITIDISSQKITFFKNDNILLTSSITTGKDSTPTNIGLFKLYSKERNRYLIGEEYQNFVEYWMPFDGGIGLHDASWRSKFGGEIYKKNGSHGCVNLPPTIAEKIYDNIEIGTKILVHK